MHWPPTGRILVWHAHLVLLLLGGLVQLAEFELQLSDDITLTLHLLLLCPPLRLQQSLLHLHLRERTHARSGCPSAVTCRRVQGVMVLRIHFDSYFSS